MTNEYESLCIAKERELAELLGWTDLYELDLYHSNGECAFAVHGKNPENQGAWTGEFPLVTRSWSACGPLMVEYGCYPIEFDGSIVIVVGVNASIKIQIADHPSKDRAVMLAIVCAVIELLKARRG